MSSWPSRSLLSARAEVWRSASEKLIQESTSQQLNAASEAASFVEEKEFLDWIRSLPDEELRRIRKQSMDEMDTMTKNSWRKSKKLWASAPESVRRVSGHINVDLFLSLLKKHGYQDTALVEDIKRGLPLTGITPSTGIFEDHDVTEDADDLPDLEKVWSGYLKTNRPSFMTQELIEHTWSTATEELESGLLREISVEEVQRNNYNVSYMFSINQSTPERKKFRSVVHYKFVNMASRIREKIRLPTHRQIACEFLYLQNGLDMSPIVEGKSQALAELERAREADRERVRLAGQVQPPSAFPSDLPSLPEVFKDRLGDQNYEEPTETLPETVRRQVRPHVMPCGFLSRDFKGAYKQMAARDPRQNICSAWDPSSLCWRYFTCSYMCFGSLWAVSSWVRISKAINFLIRRALFIHNNIYIDDIICIERLSLLTEAGRLIDSLMFKLGFEMSADKSEEGTQMRTLGLEYAVDANSITTNPRTVKRQKLAKEIANAMAAIMHEKVTARALSTICGKCNFLSTATRASGLSACLSPLYAVSAGLDEDSILPGGATRHLMPVLEHLKRLVLSVPPSTIRASLLSEDVAHFFSDASDSVFQSRACFVLIFRNFIYTGAADFPKSMLCMLAERKTKPIGILEAAALIMGLQTCSPILRQDPHRPPSKVVLYIDNTSVLFGALKGTSKDITLRIMLQEFRTIIAMDGLHFVLRYIASKSNISDGGTRSDLFPDFVAALKASKRPAILLEEVNWEATEKAMNEIARNTRPMQTS